MPSCSRRPRCAQPLRQAWRVLFEHGVFDAGHDATSHIPQERQGVLGTASAEEHARLRKLLSERLLV